MTTITELVTACLLEIERKYGTGDNDGESPKKYHNKEHTETVIADALKIADLALERHKITLRQRELLHVAAAFHDIEQDSLEYGNELASADIMDSMAASTQLFSADELLEIREIILGTEITIKQGVPTQVYAQSYLPQALADADLAGLGKPTEIYTKNVYEKYCEELYPLQRKEDRFAFLNQTVLLLKNHHFFTPEAEYLFQEQAENLRFVKELEENFEKSTN